MVETSTWQPTGGGGSWGDSSGGPKPKQTKNSYYTGDLNLGHGVTGKNVDLARELMYSGLNQYFLSKNVCEKEGLIEANPANDSKKLLLGSEIKINGDFIPTKVDDIEALVLALLANEKNHGSTVKKIYASDESANLKLICNEKIMGRRLKAYGSKVDNSELTTYIPTRPWNDFDVNKFFKQDGDGSNNHMLLMREKKYLSKNGDNNVVYLECLDDGEKINIVSKNNDWSYELEIADGELSGSSAINFVILHSRWSSCFDCSLL